MSQSVQDNTGVMAELLEAGGATNMGLERLLSLIKSASPEVKGRKPRAVKVVTRGHLSVSLRHHLDAGLPDSRGQIDRKGLIEQGVQINLRSSRILIFVYQNI